MTLAATLFVSVATVAGAQVAKMPPDYLSQVPDPNVIVASFTQADTLDRLARQYGALLAVIDMVRLLSYERMIEDNAHGRRRVEETPEETRIRQAYTAALLQLHEPRSLARGTMESPWAKWIAARDGYSFGNSFRDELLKQHFPAAWRTGYLAATKQLDTRVDESEARMKAAARPAPSRGARPRSSFTPFITLAVMVSLLLFFVGRAIRDRMLVRCANPNCDAKVHRKAMECPKCGTPSADVQAMRARYGRKAACKSCKTPLVISQHVSRYVGYSNAVVRGTTVGSYSGTDWDNVPCPSCGDPRPLKSFGIVYAPVILGTIAFFALVITWAAIAIYRMAYPRATEPSALAWVPAALITGLWLWVGGRKQRFMDSTPVTHR